MGKTVPSYRQALESEIEKWKGFRKALRAKDAEAFDRMMNACRNFASAGRHVIPLFHILFLIHRICRVGKAMRKVVITQELIDAYPYKESRWSPHRPWCKLCSVTKNQRRKVFRVLEIGEEVIEVKFRNGTVAYDHVDCWQNPKYQPKVDSMKKQSVN